MGGEGENNTQAVETVDGASCTNGFSPFCLSHYSLTVWNGLKGKKEKNSTFLGLNWGMMNVGACPGHENLFTRDTDYFDQSQLDP